MRCSFCIIPHTRGAQRSRLLAEVVAEVQSLVTRGYKEIVATGVQISAYRSGDAGLVELVEALLADTDCARLRLTSIAPWDLDQRLLDLFADRRLCRHLHLSLQSGSTATLRRMRRPYSASSFLKLLDQVRAAVPGVAVTTDVIVGFPGETAREFGESLATVEEAGFAKVHVFPFSARSGTAAAAMPGQVAAAVKRTRTQAMLEVAARAERDFLTSHLGSREVVLWEKPKNGQAHGLTDNYIRVYADATVGLRNRLTRVELVALAEGAMVGRPLHAAAAG
jgi:threonylcarbamoyladenosine tRNA methylthiotransferase MtaB